MKWVLHVSAVSAAESISVAGGWLYDHAAAGWAVAVSVPVGAAAIESFWLDGSSDSLGSRSFVHSSAAVAP